MNLSLVVNYSDQYTLPSEAYLQISGKLVKNDGTNYADTDVVALINNGVMSLFQNYVYQINGQEVEAIYGHGDVSSTILGLVRYSDDYARTMGSLFFWNKDTSGGVASITDAKSGFYARHKLLFKNGNTGFFEVCIPLSHIFGFCRDIKKVFYGVKHEILLQRRATDDEAIHRLAAAGGGKIDITKLSLWMPTVTPSLEMRNALEKWILSRSAITLYWQATQIDSIENQTATDFIWKLGVRSGKERPRHIFIAFQLSDRRNSQEQNPHVFDPLNINTIDIKLNAVKIPQSDILINFDERQYNRVFKMLSDYKGRDQDVNTGHQIDAESFRTHYPIYHFDLEKQSERLKDSISDIYVHARFTGTPANYRAYAVVQSDRTMLLSGDGSKMNIVNST